LRRRARKISQVVADESQRAEELEGELSIPFPEVEHEATTLIPPEAAAVDVDELSLDELAQNVERGIRGLPVWKDFVARFGLKEARAILRRGLIVQRITGGNPENRTRFTYPADF